MRKYIIAALWIGLGYQVAAAQRLLIVQKSYSRLSYHYKEGERLKLRVCDTGEILRGSWKYQSEDTILVNGQKVELKGIRWIDVTGKEKGVWILRKGRDLLTLAGTGYFAASQFNNLFEGGDGGGGLPVLRTSAGLVAGGIACGVLDRVVRRRKIAARHGLRMRMVELPQTAENTIPDSRKNPE
ncbi:MAG: hypothetical protein ICV83_06480 [Cytophagales bacterium]|nr:hypothetical protein [Cytophagales bacterium]